MIMDNLQKINGQGHFIVERDPEKASVRSYVLGPGSSATILLCIKKSCNIQRSVILSGPDSRIVFLGLVVLNKSCSVSLNTSQIHQAQRTESNLIVKSMLDDESAFVYDGTINVGSSAHRTDAYQRNENLLLSAQTHVESKPALEIMANDVRCTHGAATGTLAADQLWYLESRGIGAVESKRLLSEAFVRSIAQKAPDSDIAGKIDEYIVRWV